MPETSPENAFHDLADELDAIHQEEMTEGKINGKRCLISYSELIKMYQISMINADGSEILFLINLDKLTVHEHSIDQKKCNKALTPAKLSPQEKVSLINRVRNLLAEFEKQ